MSIGRDAKLLPHNIISYKLQVALNRDIPNYHEVIVWANIILLHFTIGKYILTAIIFNIKININNVYYIII